MAHINHSHLVAERLGAQEILLNIFQRRDAVKECSALKVVVEASVIQIYSAYNALYIVGDEHFGVDKAGRVLKMDTPEDMSSL